MLLFELLSKNARGSLTGVEVTQRQLHQQSLPQHETAQKLGTWSTLQSAAALETAASPFQVLRAAQLVSASLRSFAAYLA